MRKQLYWYRQILQAQARRHRAKLEGSNPWKDWGILSAPASKAQYPVLKSLQYANFMGVAFAISVLGLTLALSTPTTSTEGAFCLITLMAGIGFFIGMADYWISLLFLVCRLAQSGHLGKLSASADELFLSVHRRTFSVEATQQEVFDRIVAALSAHRKVKIRRLDIFNGVIEASLMSQNIVRSTDIEFRLSIDDNCATTVDIVSRPMSTVTRYAGEVMHESLPILFDLEEAIQRPSQNIALKPKETKPIKFWLQAYQFSAINFTLWIVMLSFVSAFSTLPADDPNCSYLQAEKMKAASNYPLALKECDKAVSEATKISDPDERNNELADCLNLRAQIICDQFEDMSLPTEARKTPSVHLSGDTFKQVSNDLEKAIKLEPRWSGAYSTKARLLALHGDYAEADKALDKAQKARELTDKPTYFSQWSEKQDLSYARAAVYAAQADTVAALQSLQESADSFDLSCRAAMLKVKLLGSQDQGNSHLSPALKKAKSELRLARERSLGLDSTDESIDPQSFLQLMLFLLGTPILLTGLLKDRYRIGAKDPFSEPAPILYNNQGTRNKSEKDESNEPPHDSLAEQFEQLTDKMRASVSGDPSEPDSTLTLKTKVRTFTT